MNATCVFCRVASGELAGHVVHRGDRVVAFLDRAPLIPGHTLVLPIAHVPTFDDLPVDLIAPVFDLVRRLSVAMQRGLEADGSFVAVNTRVSQSVPHVHVHVVPRTDGDGLFSPRPIWKRRSYTGDDEAAGYAARIKAALEGVRG
jgi:histidine triad (HIT) family protein